MNYLFPGYAPGYNPGHPPSPFAGPDCDGFPGQLDPFGGPVQGFDDGMTCNFCHIQPKYFDGVRLRPFCSMYCRQQAQSMGLATPGPCWNPGYQDDGLCGYCHSQPRFFDGSILRPFCSLRCRLQHDSDLGILQPAQNGTGYGMGECGEGMNLNGPFTGPGELDGTLVDDVCLMCRQSPKQSYSHFCGKTCAMRAESVAPLLLEVPRNHVTFTSVQNQLTQSWRHPDPDKPCPNLQAVYKIVEPKAFVADYDKYRAEVEAKGNFVSQGRTAGNECRRWHGTRRGCNLGDFGQTQLCSTGNCPLCSIIRTSFDLKYSGNNFGWERFGMGIYTSSTASKSNDYVKTTSQSLWKALLLVKVVVGKAIKMKSDSRQLTSPPSGYDAVIGEPGGALNYDELVVYRNDAIRPSFLVMYS